MNTRSLTEHDVKQAIANLDQSLPKGDARADALKAELWRLFRANGFTEEGATAFEYWTGANQYHTEV